MIVFAAVQVVFLCFPNGFVFFSFQTCGFDLLYLSFWIQFSLYGFFTYPYEQFTFYSVWISVILTRFHFDENIKPISGFRGRIRISDTIQGMASSVVSYT